MSNTHRISTLSLVAGMALSAPAMAQPGSDEVAAADEAGTETTDEVAGAPVDSTAIWPQEIIMRPLTLPAGVYAAGLDPDADRSFETVGTAVSVGYGITDQLDAGVSYGFALEEFDARGALGVGAGHAFYREGTVELVGSGGIGYSFSTEGLTPLTLGVLGQYTANEKLAVVMPANHLSIALDGEMKPATFNLPIGVGVQPASSVYAQVDTSLATIALNDAAGDTAVFGADFVPVNVGAYVSPSNRLDVGAGLSTDLKDASDTLGFFASLYYYGGL